MATPTEAVQLVAKYKYLEAEFYRRGLLAFATGAEAFTPGQRAVVAQIAKHEDAQASALAAAVGSSTPRPAPNTVYDFTAGSAGVNGAPFATALGAGGVAPWTGARRVEFFKLAQLIEDFGARTLIGAMIAAAPDPTSYALLSGLESVEARHAAQIRNMRTGASGTPANEGTVSYTTLILPWPTAALGRTSDPAYGTALTDPTTQAFVSVLAYGTGFTGAQLSTQTSNSEANQVHFGTSAALAAFDEPADTATVAAFLARFNVIA